MFSYESGATLALAIWFGSLVWLVVMINSRLERNLNQMGQRLSWLSLTPKDATPDELDRPLWRQVLKFLVVALIGLPFVLTSWLYVAMFVGTYLYRRSKDAGAPDRVREARWKLRNVAMSFDDLVREAMKMGEMDPSSFEQVRADMLAELRARGHR